MIRWTRYLILVAIALALVVVAMANRTAVTVQLLPPDLAALVGFNWIVALPLFLVIFGGVVAGIAIGFVWEWVREGKHRAAAARRAREVARLEREVAKAGTPPKGPADEVIALLDGPRKAG
ncbi:MAG: lipopolysaccharide assembly protein LapA domain-containing protein [Gemmobacter sp.]